MASAMNQAAVEGFAGGVGSLIALVSTYPLKTIYTLQAIRAVKEQAQDGSIPKAQALELWSNPLERIRVLCRSLRPEELAVLYSGLQPAAVETVCSSALYFYFYSLLRQSVVAHNRRRAAAGAGAAAAAAAAGSSRTEDIGVVASLFVAALAGAGNQLITTPAQVLATQMQARSKAKQQLEAQGQDSSHIRSDVWGVIEGIWRSRGVLGFWQGLAPSLVLVINPAIQYCAYEVLTQRTMRWKEGRAARAAAAAAARSPARAARAAPPVGAGGAVRLTPGEVFLLGAGAKIVATIVTYPLIVVKSRLQAMSEHTAEENRYGGTADAIRRIWREEGPAGFFKGMNAKLLQTALNAALMLSIKEQVYSGTAAALNAFSSVGAANSEGRGGMPSATASAAAAAAAAVAQSARAIPVSVVK